MENKNKNIIYELKKYKLLVKSYCLFEVLQSVLIFALFRSVQFQTSYHEQLVKYNTILIVYDNCFYNNFDSNDTNLSWFFIIIIWTLFESVNAFV